jgi:hypothetical protein
VAARCYVYSLTIPKALVAIHDWTFLLGPGFVVGVGNGLLLGRKRSGQPSRVAGRGMIL